MKFLLGSVAKPSWNNVIGVFDVLIYLVMQLSFSAEKLKNYFSDWNQRYQSSFYDSNPVQDLAFWILKRKDLDFE